MAFKKLPSVSGGMIIQQDFERLALKARMLVVLLSGIMLLHICVLLPQMKILEQQCSWHPCEVQVMFGWGGGGGHNLLTQARERSKPFMLPGATRRPPFTT